MKAYPRAPWTWNHIRSVVFISLLLFLLNGCDSGSSSSPNVTGVFVDDPVAGLEYQCPAGVVHTTNAVGEFTCPAGSDVTFHVGPIALGPVTAGAAVVTPLNLFPGKPTASMNLARLLQSIGSVVINGSLVLDSTLVAALPAQIDIEDTGFENSVETALGFQLVSTTEALAQLNASIAKYSGTLLPQNNAPQADAGSNQSVLVGTTVNLDASASIDTDGDTLHYTWTFDQRPAGSAAAFSTNTATTPSFVADAVGTYLISLWAYDGYVMGADQVNITALPAQPGSNAALSVLSISAGNLDPAFSATEYSYTVQLDNQVDSITVTPETSDVLASVTVNGSTVPRGSTSNPIGLSVGTNVIPVVVNAADGITSQSYSLIITRQSPQLSSDADLSALTFSSGLPTPPFSPARLVYTLSVANSVDVISVVPVASSAAAGITVKVNGVVASGSINLAEGENLISIVVLAEDGVTSQTYSVTVTRAQPLINFDASLQNLEFGPASGPAQLTPAFDPETVTYSTTLDYVHSWVDVIPTASQNGATITVNNTIPVNSGSSSGQIGLNVGLNTLHIVVTAVAGNERSYFVNVTRLPQSNDAELSLLSLSSGTLSPPFNASSLTYSAFVENPVASVTVTATTSHQYAIASVNGAGVSSGVASDPVTLAVGDNTITVVVTAQDGTTSKSYTITLVRANVADITEGYLNTLTMSEGTLTPVFNATTSTYTSVVAAATSSITLMPTTLHPTSTVMVNNVAVPSGIPSAPVPLSAGDNLIDIAVTSGDGTVTNHYSVNVTQGIPAAPQNFLALAGVEEVALTWDAVNSAHSYKVYYADSPGVTTSSSVATAFNTTTSYTFPGVNDVTYYFRVAGINIEGEGALSAEVSAMPQTFIPKNPRVSVSDGQHVLSWSPLNGAGSYSVYWNTGGSVTTADTRVDVAANTSFTQLALAAGETYYYRVSATANAVESELSQEVSATQYPAGWSWVDPLPQGNDIEDAVWGGSRYVAVGAFGIILTSPDGTSWTAQVSGTTERLKAIAWSGGRYIAVGGNGVILSSDDGLSWTVGSSGFFSTLSDVIWSGSQFVAVGGINPKVVLNSADGIRWTSAQPVMAGTVEAIAWNGTQYQLLTSDGFSASWVYRSSDLVNWTQHFLGIKGTWDITWGNGKFVVAGAGLFYTSVDGINWVVPDDGGNTQTLYAVEWLDTRFLAVGKNTLLSSLDGETWSTQTIDSRSQFLRGVTGNGSNLVAVGEQGTLLSSLNATSWDIHTTGGLYTVFGISPFTDIIRSTTQFVAVGSDITATSADGLSWSTVPVSASLNALSWNGSVYVAVGGSGKIYSSANGSSWTQRASGTTQTLEDVIWDTLTSQFLAVGWNGTILASTDGTSWAAKNPGVSDRLLGITSNGSQLVAAGINASFSDGSILTSLNGDDWTPRTSPGSTSNFYNDVVSNGSGYLIGGTLSSMLTSTDGINWSVIDFSSIQGISFDSTFWDGSQFVALTNFGQIYTSSDTSNWLSRTALMPIKAVAFNGSRIVGIGGAGVITNPTW